MVNTHPWYGWEDSSILSGGSFSKERKLDISFYTVSSNIVDNNGYGYAGGNIVRSLRELSHTVKIDNPSAPVQLNFVQPYAYKMNPGQYQIGYTPWESSHLPAGWAEAMNKMDEVWTTSSLCAKWFKQAGVDKAVRVFEHGVEPIWAPKRRTRNGPLKFLHVGEPAPRKGGQMVLDAFREVFGGDSNYSLTLKASGSNTTRVYTSRYVYGRRGQSFAGLTENLPNVRILTQNMSIDEMVGLYYSHHVMVYPSWGEGFGLIPLQALATGMPTICTEAWAPYTEFLGPLSLGSSEIESPWQIIHPGKMFSPDYHQLVQRFMDVANDYEMYSEMYFEQAPRVHARYDWKTLTKKAFSHLEV